MYTTLVPSYGRDYPSKKAVLADWLAGKDFTVCNVFSPDDGRQVNRQDAERMFGTIHNGHTWNVRFKRLTCIAVLRFNAGKWTVS